MVKVGFSIVMPLDEGRFKQFRKTKEYYDSTPHLKEYLIPTRSQESVVQYLTAKKIGDNVRLLPYSHSVGFNPSKALNLAVGAAKYDNIIITSPEVLPLTPVLDQFTGLLGKNVIAQVFDEAEDGSRVEHMGSPSLVNSSFRGQSPAMYFLALFNRSDIFAINGWDEDFMDGYAFEDNDFGDRWNAANLPFEVHDEIQAIHQYHPRSETIPNGTAINLYKYQSNLKNGVIKCRNGIIKLNWGKKL